MSLTLLRDVLTRMAADLIFPEGTSDEMSFLFRNIEWPPLSAELKTDPGVLSIMAPDSQLSPPSHPCYIQLNSVTCSMQQGADTLSHPFSGSLPLSYCALLLECVSPETSFVKAPLFLQRPAPATPTFRDFLDVLPQLPTEQNTPPPPTFRLCDISPSVYLSLPS